MVTNETIEEIRQKVARKNSLHSKKIRQSRLFNVSRLKNEFDEIITRVDGDIPVDLPVTSGDRFLFISYEQTRYTHGIHKYPAKFFPELPRWLVQRYSEEEAKVLDPFGGSGTTSIECLLNRRHSVSVDVDPFAQFLSNVKTTKLNHDELESYTDELLKKIKRFRETKNLKNFIPEFPYRDNWFEGFVLNELAFIKKTIAGLKAPTDISNFLLATFSSIIRQVSNADNNCTRTVVRKRLNKQLYPSFALTLFVEHLLLYTSRIEEFSRLVPNDISVEIPKTSDAKCIHSAESYFDLAVTSPPYVNAVDYPRTHQLEIYWLGLEQGSLTPLKKKHIGTESVSASDYKKLHAIGVPEADRVLKAIYQIDPRRSYIAFKFLEDMEKNLQEVHRVLKPDGRYAIVIGNNTIRGIPFKSWRYLISIAERNGFEVETYFGSEIIKHFIKIRRDERINTDWILILKKQLT